MLINASNVDALSAVHNVLQCKEVSQPLHWGKNKFHPSIFVSDLRTTTTVVLRDTNTYGNNGFQLLSYDPILWHPCFSQSV